MKAIVAVLLLVGATFATDLRMFDQKSGEITHFYPKYSLEGGMRSTDPGATIVGGKNAMPGQFPWQVYFIVDHTKACGGSLISSRWVLTAAHCVYLYSSFLIYFGVHNLHASDANWQLLRTHNNIFHEHFNNENLENDIALLELPSEVPITGYINVVQLPSYSMTDESIIGEDATVSGWGKTSDNSLSESDILQYAEVTILNHLECTSEYPDYNSTTMLCTRKENKGVCMGDSGGALVIWKDRKPIQVGVVSYVLNHECESGKPSYYARVFNYLKWISMKTGIAIKP